MPPTDEELLNIILQARSVEYAYQLDQWADGPLKTLLKSIQKAQKEILQYLDSAGTGLTDWSEARSVALLDHFDKLTLGIRQALGENIIQLATVAGANALLMSNDILSFGGRLEPFNNVSMTAAQLKSFVVDTPLGGKVMQEWVDSVWDFNIQEQIKQELFTGALKGESYTGLVSRIQSGFKITEEDAIDLARGYIQSANVNAQEQVFEANKDVVEGIKWVATLETGFKKSGRGTCIVCAGLDGTIYKLDEPHPQIPLHFRCLVSGSVPIYTSKGWKPIGEIEVGDLVLTHKKRFRKVTELIITPKQKPFVTKIYVRGKWEGVRGNGHVQTISLTDEHPLLIDGKWVAAKDIKIGDKISFLGNTCYRCGKLIPYFYKYCSRSCLSLDITDRQWADPNHRKNMSEKTTAQMFREYENGIRDRFEITKEAHKVIRQQAKDGTLAFHRPEAKEKAKANNKSEEYRKNASERMKKNNPNKIPEIRARMTATYMKTMEDNPERHPNRVMAKNRWNGGRTYIEQKVENYLKEIGIEYDFNHPVKRYFVDFALLDYNIAIECDGEFWHQDKEYDERRQRQIEEQGWLVIRFTGSQIVTEFEKVKNEIDRILMNHNEEYELTQLEVFKIDRQESKKNITLYNFSVEEDESYIAKGFVSHNCRCVWAPVTIHPDNLNLDIPDVEATYRPYTIRPNINIGTGRKGKIIDHGFWQGSYGDWFMEQSDRFQKNVVGPMRYELISSGKIKFEDLVDHKTGELIKIKDLIK